MSTPQSMTTHPSDETLAAFAEGRLSGAERERAEAHVAHCDECYAIWQGDVEFLASEASGAGNVVRVRFRPALIAAAMAAAIAAVAFLTPVRDRLFKPAGMRALIKASAGLDERPIEPRLSAEFPYKPAKRQMRSSAEEQRKTAELLLKHTSEMVKADPRSHARAKATAHLFLGEEGDAIATLEEELKSKGPDADLLNDLGVAYLQAGTPDRALAAIDRALALETSPRIVFNRALALQRAGKDAEARAAWNEYLKLDPDSEWADDARDKLRRLTE